MYRMAQKLALRKVATGEPYAMKVARTVREEGVDVFLQRTGFLLHSLGSGFDSLVAHPQKAPLFRRSFFVPIQTQTILPFPPKK